MTRSMTGVLLEFTAVGRPRDLAAAVEEHAQRRRTLQAIVVPWESDAATLSMAVTSVNVDGWAIEHTNLGTIRLTDLGGGRTRVVITAHEPDHPQKERLLELLDGFARQIQTRFQADARPAD